LKIIIKNNRRLGTPRGALVVQPIAADRVGNDAG
jgi:hypothetical protein